MLGENTMISATFPYTWSEYPEVALKTFQALRSGAGEQMVLEHIPMAQLLSEAAARGVMPDYVAKLLAVFESEAQPGLAGHQATPWKSADNSYLPTTQPLIEPLSQRELQVLRLISQGLSNREISGRLFLALSTIKGHNRIIFDKLQVQRRTEAVARARELGLL
jgi:LuxR family maltose regulon positive regulatory protein